jgi:hypothetical protein
MPYRPSSCSLRINRGVETEIIFCSMLAAALTDRVISSFAKAIDDDCNNYLDMESCFFFGMVAAATIVGVRATCETGLRSIVGMSVSFTVFTFRALDLTVEAMSRSRPTFR